jgi:hypothetical protein
VPIDVVAGTEALTIRYRCTGGDGSSVVDIGLFEPGSHDLGTPSFRGYSGGWQRTITSDVPPRPRAIGRARCHSDSGT